MIDGKYIKEQMDRKVNHEVKVSLYHFIQNAKGKEYLSSENWFHYYNFILVSYGVERINRYSVSGLENILHLEGIKNRGNLCTIYAHCLYTLALYNNKEIYGEHFNP